jgi:RNA polymerase sigma factor (sigma-70 family)
MNTSDQALIESCLRGEEQGWTELIGRYQRLVYSVARKLCPRTEDCADVFQRVCLDLYQSLRQLRSNQCLPAWLITVTRRRAYAVLKSSGNGVSLEDHEIESRCELESIEKEFLVEKALAELPDRCRELIRLLYLDPQEPTYAEISQRLGMPVASIGPTRARCLEKLRKFLESNEPGRKEASASNVRNILG